MTVADVGERALIERIRLRSNPAVPGLTIGIGDDAAVISPVRGRDDVVTTDSLVEDVHFRLAWSSARSVGRKAVLVNLSDLAAMGATPRALLLSLCLPAALPLDAYDQLVDGVLADAARHRAGLIGGNIARSPGPLVITVTALGTVHPRRVLTRGGGRPGDELYVTGTVGAAGAGLALLEAGASRADLAPDLAACIDRCETPADRVRCGVMVAGYRAASACMDLSDGLADAVHQMAAASGTGADVEAERIPVEAGALDWWASRRRDPIAETLRSGEDYELLFAVPPRRRRAFLAAAARSQTAVTSVGRLTAGRSVRLRRGEHAEPLGGGYEHFGDKSV